MRVSEKIKMYIAQKGTVYGCELANKPFRYWDGLRWRKEVINSCAPRIARKMVNREELKHYYIPRKGNPEGLVVYYINEVSLY